MVHLTEEQIRQADEAAARRGISRSALIRAALDAYLEGGRSAALDRRMREGYERTPRAGVDQWGDLTALADRSTREMLARLRAEEAASRGEARRGPDCEGVAV